MKLGDLIYSGDFITDFEIILYFTSVNSDNFRSGTFAADIFCRDLNFIRHIGRRIRDVFNI
ncbi:hypothetical protein BpHYR1_044678 [Brachionus plicatilis]|uniref:Uncharacterized protein n=1 Tax=Brachionus plicatilis TaxID=10195 RepID=A0A3M7T2J4_BRAPC|nr:hypothetical protein BpHYR1_044678 [Brachionus plicatilis]